jgi:hypothetical protein
MEITGKKPINILLNTSYLVSDILDKNDADFTNYVVVVFIKRPTYEWFTCISCKNKYFNLKHHKEAGVLVQECIYCGESYEVYEEEYIKFYKKITV